MPGDVHSFWILLLGMFTRRRPTDNMFNDGLTLHEFAKMALPEAVIEIVEPSLSLEVRTGNSWTRENGRVKIEECLVALVRIGVLCSTESPAQRIEMTEVVSKLRDARDCFVRTTAWCIVAVKCNACSTVKDQLKMALVHDFPKLKKKIIRICYVLFFFLREYMLRTWLWTFWLPRDHYYIIIPMKLN